MAISRVLYAAQTVLISVTGNTTYVLPSQSANADETIPVDDVLVLGKLGAAGRLQKDVASCKASVKGYICKAAGLETPTSNNHKVAVAGYAGVCTGNDTTSTNKTDCEDANVGGGQGNWDVQTAAGNLNTLLSQMRTDSISGTPIKVELMHDQAVSGGFEFLGACSSMGMDISKGNFGMLDLSFDGVGQINSLSLGNPQANNAPAIPNQASNAEHDYVNSAIPTISSDVILPVAGHNVDTVANLKFSYDMPTENLSRLGGIFLGNTNDVKGDNVTFSKPPFKSSMTVDGQSIITMDTNATTDASTNKVRGFDIGGLGVELIQPAVSARSMSQAVGDVGASFNLTLEGTDAEFRNPQTIGPEAPAAAQGDIV